MADKIRYNGEDKWKKKATELLNESGGGSLVDDVLVNGVSVVNQQKEAEIDLTPYALTTYVQTNYYTKTDIDTALADKANTADLGTAAAKDYTDAITYQSPDLVTSGAVWNRVEPTFLNIENALFNRYTKSETYSREEITDILYNYPSYNSVYTKTEVNNLLDDKQDSLMGGTISSGDLDDYTTIGHYYVNSAGASVVSNLPVSLAGYLEVVQPSTTTGGSRLQRYTAISSNTVVGVYERNYNNSAWQSWVRIDGNDLYLPLTGGTLAGDLTIAETTPSIVLKDTSTSFTVDTSSNNGVTTQQDDYVTLQDSSGLYFGRFRSSAYTDGRIASIVDARNMRTDGTRVSNYLGIGVNKDGSRYFVMPNDAYGDARSAFRSAIAINDSPTILEPNIAASQSVPTGTYKSLGSFELTTGTWLISYKAQFAAEDTGLRRIMLTSSSGSSSPWADSRISSHASHSGIIDIGWTTIVRITSSSVTRYLTAYQNSGSAVNVTGYVKAIKIINV